MSSLEKDVVNISGKKVGSASLDESVFGEEVNEHLIWETVKWQLAKRRAGTHKTKSRGEVRGSNIKPWKQKGTGRARSGDRQSPIWVGGGRAFGPRPRSYAYPMNKKARKKALRGVLSMRSADDQLIIVDDFTIAGGKTKAVAAALKAVGVGKSALIVDIENTDLARGTKNLPKSDFLAAVGLNVYDVLRHETLILTKASVDKIGEVLRP